MRKVSKAELDSMRARGKTITPVSVAKEPAAAAVQPVPMASMSAVIEKIAQDNKNTIERFANEVKKIVGRKRKPWLFTVNRNKQGSITTVSADPIE